MYKEKYYFKFIVPKETPWETEFPQSRSLQKPSSSVVLKGMPNKPIVMISSEINLQKCEYTLTCTSLVSNLFFVPKKHLE